jgi:hypothetical protein
VYVLCVISPAWPVIVVGCIGALLFVVAEVDELMPDRKIQPTAPELCRRCSADWHALCLRPESRFPANMSDRELAGLVQVCCCNRYRRSDGSWYQLGKIPVNGKTAARIDVALRFANERRQHA